MLILSLTFHNHKQILFVRLDVVMILVAIVAFQYEYLYPLQTGIILCELNYHFHENSAEEKVKNGDLCNAFHEYILIMKLRFLHAEGVKHYNEKTKRYERVFDIFEKNHINAILYILRKAFDIFKDNVNIIKRSQYYKDSYDDIYHFYRYIQFYKRDFLKHNFMKFLKTFIDKNKPIGYNFKEVQCKNFTSYISQKNNR